MQERLLYDLETNGFLDKATVIHCAMIQNLDDPSGEVFCYHDDPSISPRHGSVAEGIDRLEAASRLSGHNIIDYDDRVLQKLAPLYGRKWRERLSSEVFDTLVASRLVYSDRKERDYILERKRSKTPKPFPKKYIGSHSLGAWGHRLGELKGEFNEFDVFTQEMLDYGIQDVLTNRALYDLLVTRLPDFGYEGVSTSDVEHHFALEMTRQETRGVRLDQRAGDELLGELNLRRLALDEEIQAAFPPLEVPYKVNSRTGKRAMRLCPIRGRKCDSKLVPFNPGSRSQLAARLTKRYGWVPKEIHKKTGNAVMQERILLDLATMYPEVGLVAEWLVVNSRISILQDSPNSYFRLCDDDGRLHGRTHHIGTVTHRVSHASPNLGNVTSIDKPYGKEIRRIFIADEGFEQVGFDASGIQLRGLGHYLAKWDDGAYGYSAAEGTEEQGTDVHSLHKKAISHAIEVNRKTAKTCTYAFLFGAGDGKLGRICNGSSSLGKQIRAALENNITGLGPLVKSLNGTPLQRGWLTTPDKRRVGIRHKHATLNTLLMSFEAAVMKWMSYWLHTEMLPKVGILPGVDFRQTGMIHDEIQGSLKPGNREAFSEAVDLSFNKTRESLGIRVPLDGSAKFGLTWADTH